MIYKLNGTLIDINAEHQIGNVNYPRNWFLDAGNRLAAGITEHPDPVLPPLTPAEVSAAIARNVDMLWHAASGYESAQISGVAVGLLTIGVMQAKPKSLAIAAWSASIWNLYYARKAAITPAWDAALADFTLCGTIPYSVPELRIELGM